jgi:hypothetical protein
MRQIRALQINYKHGFLGDVPKKSKIRARKGRWGESDISQYNVNNLTPPSTSNSDDYIGKFSDYV